MVTTSSLEQRLYLDLEQCLWPLIDAREFASCGVQAPSILERHLQLAHGPDTTSLLLASRWQKLLGVYTVCLTVGCWVEHCARGISEQWDKMDTSFRSTIYGVQVPQFENLSFFRTYAVVARTHSEDSIIAQSHPWSSADHISFEVLMRELFVRLNNADIHEQLPIALSLRRYLRELIAKG